MRIALLATLALGAALAACRAEHPAPAADRRSAVGATTSAPTIAAADADADEDSSCGLSHAVAHPDPDTLVAEFLRRDAEGEFLQASDWLDGAHACPDHEGGPDAYVVIRDYAPRELRRLPDTLEVLVTSHVLGTADYRGFVPDTATSADTVRAVRTPYGWRIASLGLRLRVLEEAARRRGDLHPPKPDDAGAGPS